MGFLYMRTVQKSLIPTRHNIWQSIFFPSLRPWDGLVCMHYIFFTLNLLPLKKCELLLYNNIFHTGHMEKKPTKIYYILLYIILCWIYINIFSTRHNHISFGFLKKGIVHFKSRFVTSWPESVYKKNYIILILLLLRITKHINI